MYQQQENIFYYVTMMNENYAHPALPKGSEEGILAGMYLLSQAEAQPGENAKRVQLFGSGTILREVMAAAKLLQSDFGVPADVWSVTSFTELRREGLDCERWNRLHPGQQPRVSYVAKSLAHRSGPVIAATDYMKAYADQIRTFVPERYVVLGTDGFGRSDTRQQLRKFFEVNRHHVAVAALDALARDGRIPAGTVVDAIGRYGIDAERPNPARM